MKFKLIWFTLITVFTAVNSYVTYQYRDFLTVSKLPICFLMLSYLCISLLLFNMKSRPLRAVTYTLNILVLLLAITYAIYCRRPLGFYIVFVSSVLFAKNIIAGPNSKDRPLTKIVNTVLLSVLFCHFGHYGNYLLGNGARPSGQWCGHPMEKREFIFLR